MIWLVTTGDGSDGNEWNVQGIFTTLEKAKKFLAEYTAPRKAYDSNEKNTYSFEARIEEWETDPLFTPLEAV